MNAGMPARRAAINSASEAVDTVMSPLSHSASMPRASSDAAASTAAVLLSALASTSSIPRSLQTLLPINVWARELASAAFHTSPIRLRSGRIDFAMRSVLSTGCMLP